MAIPLTKADALPREFMLVAACCRWPVSAPVMSAVVEAAAGPIDWPYFARVVARQRVAGLVANALRAAGIAVPPGPARALAAGELAIGRHNLRLEAETVRLQRAFVAAGIPAPALKGISLAQIAYGSSLVKHGRDIDLLVPPQHALAGMALLESLGYGLQDPAREMSEAQRRAFVAHGREAEFVHRGGGLRVELHWRLTDNPALLRGIDAYSPGRDVTLAGGESIRTLADDDLFAYLCVHGAVHAWSRLKWLADLDAFIAGKPDAELVRLYRHAQGKGAGLCAGQALMLCRDLLRRRLPPALEADLARSRRIRRLVAVALAAMVGADAATEHGRGAAELTRSALTQFLLGEGPAFYAAQLRIVAIAVADVIRFPLPPALYFLYPLLRLPSWIWRHMR
jgi:hypothetical protein